jgi:prepilin-type N-terminal cleavage/methylation domain-containing protein
MKNFLKQSTSFAQGYGASRGFTLVELLVSLALFTIVVTAAVGSLYSVNQASAKVGAMRTVLDNLTFATESMSRTIRTGNTIVCGGVDNQSGNPNCPIAGQNGPGNEISLNSTIDGKEIEYRWRTDSVTGNNEIQKCSVTNNSVTDNNCVSITDPQINVKKMSFYVDGADPADGKQPSVIIIMQGTANAGVNNVEPFNIQLYASQRAAE